MVARGTYDSRVIVEHDHVSFTSCNSLRTECTVEPPAIHCTRSAWGLKGCRSPEQEESDRRARRYIDLAMLATTLRIEGRELVFYAADDSRLFALHQYIESEACERVEAEPERAPSLERTDAAIPVGHDLNE